MKKAKRNLLLGILAGAMTVAAIGAVAYFTNGFKDTNKIRNLTKTGKVVETLVLTDDSNYFFVKDKNSDLEGSKLLSVNDVLENAINGFEDYENYCNDFDIDSKDLEKQWAKISVRERAFHEHALVNFQVEKDEQEDSHFVEMDYFDTMRINYSIDTDALAIAYSFNNVAEKSIDTTWGYTSDGTGLFQEISIFNNRDIADSVLFSLFTIEAARNFEVEFESVELVCKSTAKAKDTLYMYDYANHI